MVTFLSILIFILGVVSPEIITEGDGFSSPVFVITSPKRAKYDTETTFAVSVTNLAHPERIHLVLRTGNASEIALNETYLHFTSNGVQTWSVVIDSERMLRYVQRTVQLRAQLGGVSKVMEIPMNTLSGYIMVQTDKVIYSPRQTVMYRVIALDDDQRFARWPVTVDIKNPDLIILERQHHTGEEAFLGRNFSLPRDATTGTWTITASFEGIKVRTTRTVQFEVQEYVLPTFKVEVGAMQKVISLTTNWILVQTKAVYSYGEPVQGRIDLRLGVVEKERISLFNFTYSGMLVNGQWNYPVPVSQMRSHSAWFPDGLYLYLEANLTEEGTGEKATAVAMDSIFANPYYRISFDRSKKHFKPGFSYTLAIDVTAANGDRASMIVVFVIVDIKSADGNILPDGFSSTFMLDQQGRMNDTFPVPLEAHVIEIKIYKLDPAAPDPSPEEFIVKKFESTSSTYIHLEKEGNNIRVQYTPASPLLLGPAELITVLIVSKGRLIYTSSLPRDNSGSSLLPLPPDVLLATAPSARVLAYFSIGYTMEIVADSLFLETGHLCREELGLQNGFHNLGNQLPLLPKQTTELRISGGSRMRVGLLAVDKAVYFLRDRKSLTREMIFELLDESDEGQGIGDGPNSAKIFEFAGLMYETLTDELHLPDLSVDEVLDLDRLNVLEANGRGNLGSRLNVAGDNLPVLGGEETIPLEEVRKFFPESFLFKELTLPANGFSYETITMPDSITTWAFTAVGVGAEGGICMSHPLEVTVFKPFFAQVRLPYKAVRLEEVTVHIGIYNYKRFDVNVTVTVHADIGLCFTEGFGNQNRIRYRTTLRAGQTNSESLRVIPLVVGTVSLTVDVMSDNGFERDIVEKTLDVVAEGRPVQKSITFPLDPSGQHSSHHPVNRNGIQRTNTATVTNRIIRHRQKQLTYIDLFMPQEIVQGSEKCQISACGDLMGDIISTAVIQGNNLFENSVVDAEEAIGNLAPTVHALLYLNNSHFMTPFVQARGRAHVTFGVSRLLSYRKQLQDLVGSFALTQDTQPATWLTALVLKTLCHAEQIVFIHHDTLIQQGFLWLLEQIREDGFLTERDRRLAQASREYDLMLSAETLIALLECNSTRFLSHDDLILMGRLEMLLSENFHDVTSPLVMAKIAYALTLADAHDDVTQEAVRQLTVMKRVSSEGLQYWSVIPENEPPQKPFWYHSGTKASSIEATAYALLVFSRQAQANADVAYDIEEPANRFVNLDSIASWLIQKRNSRGAFIGALDTAAATQALAQYSLAKHDRQVVNLHCHVTTRPTRNYTHYFDFNEDNAIMSKTLSNVPVGRQLHIETQGTGLGQMQVRVEYNVPVDANAECRYNVTIRRHTMSYTAHHTTGDEVCQYCNMGCDDDEVNNVNRRRREVPAEQSEETDVTNGRRIKRRITASRVSICIEVCLRSAEQTYSDRTILEIGMLSGFQPLKMDLIRLYQKRDQFHLSSLIWLPEKESVQIKLTQVPHDRNTCFSFRAIERQDVDRRNPALVTVRAHEDREVTCVTSYDPVVSEINLAVYCANNQTSNQGQCRCISGFCGNCQTRSADISLTTIQNLVCQSEYIYKVHQISTRPSDEWVDITAEVVGTLKNGTEAVEQQIEMVTPKRCACPHSVQLSPQHYFFGSNVNIFVDRDNRQKKTYLLDETTTFINPDLQNNRDRTGAFIDLALQTPCGQ